MKNQNLSSVIAPVTLLVFLVVFAEIAIELTGISQNVLPKPSNVLINTSISFYSDILPHFIATLKYVFIGIFIAVPLGILTAAIFSQLNLLVKAMTPYIIFLVVTPMITMIPILKLWMGLNPNIRIVAVVIQAVPIITLNTLTGFTNIDSSKLEVMRSLGATRLQIFIKAVFPNALPQVFTGIKLGCIFGILATIAADFVLKGMGIGVRMLQYSRYLLIDKMFGCIVLVAIIGFSIFSLVGYIEKKIIVWKI